MRWLNERTQSILEYLLMLSSPVSLGEISEHFQIARRTVYNEIGRANVWLKSSGFAPIEIQRGKIEPLSSNVIRSIRRRLEEKEKNLYILSPQERVWLIIALVLSKTDRILIGTLLDLLEVSRTTLLADLKAVQSSLASYGLSLSSKGRAGYEIEGCLVTKRALFLMLLNRIPSLPKETYLYRPRLETIQERYILLKRVEARLHHEYIEEDLYDLAVLLTFCNQESINFEEMDRNRIEASEEFQAVQEFFDFLSRDEQIYLTLHFLGSRLTGFSKEDFDSADPELLSITDAFIQEFQNAACVEFDDFKSLRQALFHHIKASRYRYRYGIQIGSPLEKDIRQEYPEIFRITQETAVYLEQALQVHITDGEIAYLALHFGAFLSIPHKKENQLRILIVCVSGISAANMIAREVRQLLPSVEITGIESLRSLANPHLKADLIISSVEFQALIPVIMVHPVLTREDRNNILNHPLVAAHQRQGNAQALYLRLADLVSEENREILKTRLIDYFSFAGNEKEARPVHLAPMLDGRIRVFDGAPDWKQALRLAASPLLERDEITQGYINTMIWLSEEMGPYMFMTNDVVIAHAKPEEGVNELCISLAYFKEPVDFLGRPARFLFVLGAIDQSTHFPLLKEIRSYFKKTEDRENLLQAKCAEELAGLPRTKSNA